MSVLYYLVCDQMKLKLAMAGGKNGMGTVSWLHYESEREKDELHTFLTETMGKSLLLVEANALDYANHYVRWDILREREEYLKAKGAS